MAPETDQMTGGTPAPPTAAPPPPPMGAMNKGVTGADPTNTAAPTAPAASPNDPENKLMAEATRLGGPLGGIAIGAATGAAHHAESANQSDTINRNDPKQVIRDPKFLGMNPEDQYSVLMSIDPKFAALAEPDRDSVIANLTHAGAGAANLSTPEDIGTGPEGTIGTDQLMSQESQADASKKGGILAGTMVGALAAPAAAAAVGGGLVGSIAGGAAAGGAQEVTQQVAEGQNPFRAQMMKETGKGILTGAAAGGVGHVIGSAIGAVGHGVVDTGREAFIPSAEEATGGLPSEVTESHFTPVPDKDIPRLAGGKTPFVGDQPFDTATIASMRQGRTLPADAANLLKEYAGDTIQAGSHELNTAMKAVAPVNEAVDRLGLEMNKAVRMYPSFAQSANEDAEIGTPLIEDLQTMKERLPHGASGKQSEIITKAHAAAHDALVSTDPQEILAMRRKLGQQIDWSDLTQNPDTDKEVQQAARARIYQALTDKLKQIPGVKEIDAEFQPNLELRTWLNKVLPEGMAYDSAAADAMQASEFKKGLKINAINAHNDRVASNRAIAGKALRYGAEAIGGGGLVYEAAKAALPKT